MTEEADIIEEQEEKGQKYSMVNPYVLFDKLERYPAEIFKQVFLLLKKYDQHIAATGTTDGFDVSNEPWEVQMAFDYNKDFIERGCLKWLKKASVARENGKRGGRPRKDVEKRSVKKEAPKLSDPGASVSGHDGNAACKVVDFENNLKNQNNNIFKNRQKPNRFFCAFSKPDRIKNAKINPVGHNVYRFKCLNVVCSKESMDRGIGGAGEKGKGCITCGQVVDLFRSGGKQMVWAALKNALTDG